MSIYVRNLTIDAHSDFSEPLELFQTGGTRTNLTGMSGAAQMRKHPDSSTAYDFTVGITSAVDGKLELSMTSSMQLSLIKFSIRSLTGSCSHCFVGYFENFLSFEKP